MTKTDCNQYQYIIAITFVYKTFKDAATGLDNRESAK